MHTTSKLRFIRFALGREMRVMKCFPASQRPATQARIERSEGESRGYLRKPTSLIVDLGTKKDGNVFSTEVMCDSLRLSGNRGENRMTTSDGATKLQENG